MRRTVILAAGLATALAAGLACRADAEGDDEVPFPVSRSQVLRKEKVVYFVEGRQTIPKGVEVSCQKDVSIRARGADAVLVVEGSLQVHGVTGRQVIFEGLTIEPAREFEDVQLDMCTFRGGGVRTPKDTVAAGRLFLEHVDFDAGAVLDVTFEDGNIDVARVGAGTLVRIVVKTPEGARSDDVRLTIRDCYGDTHGLKAGLYVEGANDVTVRTNHLAGPSAVFVDCDSLTFDANKVNVDLLEFRQSAPGCFGKTKLQKCDIYSPKISAFAPPDGTKTDKITIDKCWFRGVEKESDVRAAVIADGEAKPEENGARFVFKKINERPLELAGAVDR